MDVLKYFPEYNKSVILRMKRGNLRKGYYWGGGCFHLTDCTHPMQNINCPYDYVDSWRYEDENDFGVQENYIQRITEGEEILKSIKPNAWHEVKEIKHRIGRQIEKYLLSILITIDISLIILSFFW